MTEAFDPIVWYYLLTNGKYDTVRIIDQYDPSECYESSYRWEERLKWDAARDMMKACFIAEACVVVFEDVDGNCLFWIQVILDEGQPIISNYSAASYEDRLIETAQMVSDRVMSGDLSLHTVMAGGVDLINEKEINND